MAEVTIRDPRKACAAIEVIHDVDFESADRPLVPLGGHAGCGKSTLGRGTAEPEGAATSPERAGRRPGGRIRLRTDPVRRHLIDAATGACID